MRHKNLILSCIGMLLCGILSAGAIFLKLYAISFVANGILLGLFVNYLVSEDGLVYKICHFFYRFKISYILEFVIFLSLEIFFLYFVEGFLYKGNVDWFGYGILTVLAGLFFSILFTGLSMCEKDAASIFLLIGIPLALSFAIYVLPDMVANENMHFAKAWLTSTFQFKNMVQVKLPKDYVAMGITNYKQLRDALFMTNDYKQMVTQKMAMDQSYLLYLVPAMMIRTLSGLHLSTYACYLGARVMNVILFLIIGYLAIRVTPSYKKLFMVCMFNPVFLKQVSSLSSDSILYSIIIFTIAYFFYFYQEYKEINYLDIFVVILLITFIAITKHVYLVVFGIYFLVLNKVFRMHIFKWLFLGVCCGLGILAFIYVSKYACITEKVPSVMIYFETNKVDAAKQISFILSNPVAFLKAAVHSVITNGQYYITSFVGLDMKVKYSIYVMYGYFGVLVLASIFDEGNVSFIGRIFLIVVAALFMGAVFLQMYLYWTGVGANTVSGIEGRYFIPGLVLVFMAIGGWFKKVGEFSFYQFLLFGSTLAVNAYALSLLVVSFI
ncbi:MAG: DUF2142 domain-containing protein [Firmicutes bacterium]|nr:DUF2142 domain-containing protein [Bacillota bacterium]